jgi:uncharacterized protein YeaO (DUF488 family)
MKYIDTTKNSVQVDNTTVPRNHRLWYELEIDKAEEAGTIEEYVEPVTPYTELRAAAYKEESDQLFFEGQYDNDLTVWKDKVAEIKARYPKGEKV